MNVANSKAKADDALLDFAEAIIDCGYCVTDMSIDKLKVFISDYCHYVIKNAFLPNDRVNDTNKHWKEMQGWDKESQAYFLAYLATLLVFKVKDV